jgi:putative SbcD/Mre11-related phosphoesterase
LLKVVPREAALIFMSKDSTALLISDLHLGLEKEMASKGFRIPPYSMKMMEKIKEVAENYKTERIIVLGDVKHSIGKVEAIDWSILPWFFDTLLDLFSSVEVVPGNHDGGIKSLLPAPVKLHPSSGVLIGYGEKIGIAHGHAWPSQEVIMSGKIVMGHSHFTYQLKDKFGAKTRESVWLFTKYEKERLLKQAGYTPNAKGTGELVVMPSFNRLVGGHPINSVKSLDFGPVLSSGCIDLSEADIFLLDGTRIS